jgi:hypothetical protein
MAAGQPSWGSDGPSTFTKQRLSAFELMPPLVQSGLPTDLKTSTTSPTIASLFVAAMSVL